MVIKAIQILKYANKNPLGMNLFRLLALNFSSIF